LLLIYNRLLS